MSLIITGLGIDIDKKGLMFRMDDFGKGLMDVTWSNVTMGGAGAASMGSVGDGASS